WFSVVSPHLVGATLLLGIDFTSDDEEAHKKSTPTTPELHHAGSVRPWFSVEGWLAMKEMC
ncbi:hypothetical protein HN51_039153, partial [Arachis hypogaea]